MICKNNNYVDIVGSWAGIFLLLKAKEIRLKINLALSLSRVYLTGWGSPNQAFKLFNEAAIPYKCSHNHIIKINSGEILGFNNETLFVVDMDLANGTSIDNVLKHSSISVLVDRLHLTGQEI